MTKYNQNVLVSVKRLLCVLAKDQLYNQGNVVTRDRHAEDKGG